MCMQGADGEDVEDNTPRTTPVLSQPLQGLSYHNNNSTSSFEHWPSVASFGGKAFQAACGRLASLSNTATGNGCRRPPSCGPDRSDTALDAAPRSHRSLLGVSCASPASSVRAVDMQSCYSSKVNPASDRNADFAGFSGPRSAPRAASNKSPNLDYAIPKSAAASARRGSSRAQAERDSDFYMCCSSSGTDLEAAPRQVSQLSRQVSRQSQLYIID